MPLSDQENENPFGFAKDVRSKIRNIVPSGTPPLPDIERVDAIAGKAGFVSREASEPSARGRVDEPVSAVRARRPTMALNMRASVDVARAYIAFCAKERYSYPEGLEELMYRSGILERKRG